MLAGRPTGLLLSPRAGTIYFCCGATNKFDKGCISAKHTELSAIDTDLKTNEGRLAAVVKRPRESRTTAW